MMDKDFKKIITVVIIGFGVIISLSVLWCLDYRLQTVDTIPFAKGEVIDVDYAGESRITIIQIEGGKRFSLGHADYNILIGHSYRFYKIYSGLSHIEIGVYYEEIS